MQRLVQALLGIGDVVVELAWQRPPDRMDDAQRRVAVRNGLDQHANRQLIVDLVDVDAATLHLAVDAVDVLRTPRQVSLDAVLFEVAAQHFDHALDVLFARDAAAGHLVGDLVVLLRLEVSEGQVFELPLQLPDAQAVRQRGVDLHCFLSHAASFGGRTELQRLHVVQPVGQLDQHDTDVLGHRQEHLAHVLRPQVLAVELRQALVAIHVQELHLVELGDAIDQPRDFAPEAAFELGHWHVAVFGHVVAQRGHDGCRVHVDACQALGHRERVVDVRLARLAQLRRVGFGRELVGASNRVDVGRRQVLADVVEERLRAARGGRSGGHLR